MLKMTERGCEVLESGERLEIEMKREVVDGELEDDGCQGSDGYRSTIIT